jgi:phage gp29-like protein
MAEEGEEVLGATPVNPPAAPPVGIAAARAIPTAPSAPEQDAIDRLAASLGGDWREVIAPLADPIQAALDESHANGETAEQFIARLPALLEKMDPAALTEQLARAAFSARLMGEAGIDLSSLPQAGGG